MNVIKKIDNSKYITLEKTWVKPASWVKPNVDDILSTKEDFGAFSISAAVRGSYCTKCGRLEYEDIPGVY